MVMQRLYPKGNFASKSFAFFAPVVDYVIRIVRAPVQRRAVHYLNS